jgi:chloramphenicol O-acetyltransferase type A
MTTEHPLHSAPGKHAIDLNHYARADILRAFLTRQMPQFSTTCEVNVTGIKRGAEAAGVPFFIAISYAVSRAVNEVPEFRQRMVDGVLYEFERIDPGYTVARDNDLFSFCDSVYFQDFAQYRAAAQASMEAVKSEPDLSVGEKHHMFFITSIPWFSFTAFTHPYDPVYAFIPIITLGKLVERGDALSMPVAVQVHHGVIDGLHVGRFYSALSDLSTRVSDWLS